MPGSIQLLPRTSAATSSGLLENRRKKVRLVKCTGGRRIPRRYSQDPIAGSGSGEQTMPGPYEWCYQIKFRNGTPEQWQKVRLAPSILNRLRRTRPVLVRQDDIGRGRWALAEHQDVFRAQCGFPARGGKNVLMAILNYLPKL